MQVLFCLFQTSLLIFLHVSSSAEAPQVGSDLQLYSRELAYTAQAVCKVKAGNAIGSGFLCTFRHPQGGDFYGVMTNNHVIGEELLESHNGTIELRFEAAQRPRNITFELRRDAYAYFTNKPLDATFIALDREMQDQIKWMNLEYLTVSEISAKVNQSILIFQYPLGGNAHFAEGKIAEKLSEGHVLHSASTHHGSSGSPVLVCQPGSKCFVVALHKAGDTGHNWATSISFVFDAIIIHGLTHIRPTWHTPRHLTTPSKIEALFKAVDSNDVTSMKKLLPLIPRHHLVGKSILEFLNNTFNGDTPLHGAARKDHIETIRLLWYHMRDLGNYRNRNGSAPIHVAAQNNSTQVVDYLLGERKSLLELKEGQKNDTPLHIAASRGYLELVKLLVEKHRANLAARNKDDALPIHLAASHGHKSVVEYLLGQNSSLADAETKLGDRPIHVAVLNGQHEVVEYLLSRQGANVEQRYGQNGSTVLHLAAQSGHLRLVQILAMSYDANPNAKCNANNLQRLPIHMAALFGHVKIVDFFLSVFPDLINAKDQNGNGLTHLAALGGHSDVIDYLITRRGYNVEQCQEKHGNSPLYLAAMKGHLELVTRLVTVHKANTYVRTKSKRVPIHAAARWGHLPVVQYFLELDPNLNNAMDELGNQPIHMAAKGGHSGLVGYFLSTKRLSVEVRNSHGATPLHIAASEGHLELAMLLVYQYGANVYQTDKTTSMPIHLAVQRGHFDVVKYLLTVQPLLVLEKDGKGKTPMAKAVQNSDKKSESELVSFLLLKQAQVVLRSAEIGDANTVKAILPTCPQKFLTDMSIWKSLYQNEKGDSPLHLAARAGHLNVLSGLWSVMSELAVSQNNDKLTPIHVAVLSNSSKIVEFFLQRNNSLLELADGQFGRTPLHIAAKEGLLELVKLLVGKHKANVEAKSDLSDDEMMPIHLAARYGHSHVVEYFLNVNGLLVEAEDGRHRRPIHVAASFGQIGVVDFLRQDQGVTPRCQGRTLLHLAALGGHLDLVRHLVAKHNVRVFVRSSAKEDEAMPIHFAARHGYLEIVQFFLQVQPDLISETDLQGNLPIHHAAIGGQSDVVEYLLLDRNVGVEDCRNRRGQTPLHLAASEGHLQLVQLLVTTFNANVYNNNEEMPIHLAASKGRPEIVQYLIDSYPDLIAAKDAADRSPLKRADEAGASEVAEWLKMRLTEEILKAAEECNFEKLRSLVETMPLDYMLNKTTWMNCGICDEGDSPLHLAATCDIVNTAVLLWLQTSEMAYWQNNEKMVPIHIAALHNSINVVDFLLHQDVSLLELTGGKMGRTPLHFAASEGHLDLVKLLVPKYNASVSARSSSEDLASMPIHLAASSGHIEVVDYFLEVSKGLVEAADGEGNLPIHRAALNGHTDLVENLIERYGSSEGMRNTITHSTPLHLAASKGHLELVELLVSKFKADVYAGNDGLTPVQLDAQSIDQFLLVSEQHLHQKCQDDETISLATLNGHVNVVQYLLTRCPDLVHSVTASGHSLLHQAAKNGHLDLVRVLVEKYNASITARSKDEFESMPIHLAAYFGHTKVVDYFLEHDSAMVDPKTSGGDHLIHLGTKGGRMEVVDYLVRKREVYVDQQNDISGCTALHISAEAGHLEMVKMLTEELKSNVYAKCSVNGYEMMPIHFAARRNHLNVVRFLIKEYTDLIDSLTAVVAQIMGTNADEIA